MDHVLKAARLLLVLNLVVSTQGFLFAQGMFTLRRDYVAERLCIYRNVPDADCHGHCFMERMQEQQRRDLDRTERGLEVTLAASWLPADAVSLPSETLERPTPPPPALVPAPLHPQAAPEGVFHPPRVA